MTNTPAGAEFAPPPHHTRIFVLILVGSFCGQLGLSIISPFFPNEAGAKAVSEGVLGWIFSIFELATMLGTPIAMWALVRLGSKPLLVAGNMLGGLGNILLGLCWYVGSGAPFVTCCFALRTLAGFSFAVASTTGQALLPALFGPSLSTAAGTMEGVIGLAMICGPIVGSALFALGGGEDSIGYVLPFLVLGGIELTFGALNFLLLPTLPLPPTSKPSLRSFSWKVVLPCVNCVVNGISLGLIGPTLAPHLSKPPLEYSVTVIGFVFAAACMSYAVCSPIAGAIDDYTNARFAIPMMAFGNFVTGAGYAFAGPVPLQIDGHKLELSASCLWTGACLIGVGVSFGLIPVYKQILKQAVHEDVEERDLATAALFTVSMSAGAFLGPTLGGMLSEALGVQIAYTYCACILVALSLILFICSTLPAIRVRPGPGDCARSPPLLNS